MHSNLQYKIKVNCKVQVGIKVIIQSLIQKNVFFFFLKGYGKGNYSMQSSRNNKGNWELKWELVKQARKETER